VQNLATSAPLRAIGSFPLLEGENLPISGAMRPSVRFSTSGSVETGARPLGRAPTRPRLAGPGPRHGHGPPGPSTAGSGGAGSTASIGGSAAWAPRQALPAPVSRPGAHQNRLAPHSEQKPRRARGSLSGLFNPPRARPGGFAWCRDAAVVARTCPAPAASRSSSPHAVSARSERRCPVRGRRSRSRDRGRRPCGRCPGRRGVCRRPRPRRGGRSPCRRSGGPRHCRR
jgi:hypothetical protein